MRWRKVTLVGVGLLGGSLGLALKQRGLAGRVEGFVRKAASIPECLEKGAVDAATLDLRAAVEGADLIVLCTPLAQMAALARAFAPQVSPGAIVTDVGSVKGPIVEDLEPVFAARGAAFVGSHPMAGSEKMGVGAARADLFHGATCVVTTPAQGDSALARAVEELWRSVGGRTLRLDASAHDILVANTSHLPHVLAAHLARHVLGEGRPPEQWQLCAGGFKDSTRIAAGSPEMWRDIMLMNRKQVIRAIGEFTGQLREFQAMLEKNDPAETEAFFREAKLLRDRWAAQAAPVSPE